LWFLFFKGLFKAVKGPSKEEKLAPRYSKYWCNRRYQKNCTGARGFKKKRLHREYQKEKKEKKEKRKKEKKETPESRKWG
jgi:hypothetical protein